MVSITSQAPQYIEDLWWVSWRFFLSRIWRRVGPSCLSIYPPYFQLQRNTVFSWLRERSCVFCAFARFLPNTLELFYLLLYIFLWLGNQVSLRDQVYVAFDLLAGLPGGISNLVGEQVIAGLILVIQKHKDIIRLFSFLCGSTVSLMHQCYLGPKLSGNWYSLWYAPQWHIRRQLECRLI